MFLNGLRGTLSHFSLFSLRFQEQQHCAGLSSISCMLDTVLGMR